MEELQRVGSVGERHDGDREVERFVHDPRPLIAVELVAHETTQDRDAPLAPGQREQLVDVVEPRPRVEREQSTVRGRRAGGRLEERGDVARIARPDELHAPLQLAMDKTSASTPAAVTSAPAP